jgi:hypothetical protein
MTFSRNNTYRLAYLSSLAVFVIGSMVYYRSSEEESPEIYKDTIAPWLLPMAILAGLNEALEVHDHMIPSKDNEAVEAAQLSLSELSPASYVIGSLLVPPLIACTVAHYLQGVALAEDFRDSDDYKQTLLAFGLSIPALSKLLFMTLPHLAHTLNGTREQFSLTVTNNEVTKKSQQVMPPIKWWLGLALMLWVHIPEGELIASPIEDPLLKWSAVYGFALAECLPHINQIEQIRANLNTAQLKNSSASHFTLAALVAIVSGLLHSSQTILAVMATSNETTGLHEIAGPIAFEFGIGLAEGLQHGVPAVKRTSAFIAQTFFGGRPAQAPAQALAPAQDAHAMPQNH